MQINNLSKATSLGTGIALADNFFTRLVGLLTRKRLLEGEGLLLTKTRAVHTWGMRFTIDCLFLDRQNQVVQTLPGLAPWRFSPVVRGACQVLELPSGTITRTATLAGDTLVIKK
ncbi:MAG: DUF192 domain-containing protein [Methylocystaceae bacterium]